MRVWGRVNSANVKKVLWCLEELGLTYERIDAGMEFGVVNGPSYRALNPNGRVPTLEDGAVVMWESNSIMRYLCLANPDKAATLYPATPAVRAGADRWLDWQLSTLTPAERGLFFGMVRTAPEKRDMAAITASAQAAEGCWRLVDGWLAAHGTPYLEGADFTLADIAIGTFAKRWFGLEWDRPKMPVLEDWYKRVSERPGFVRFVSMPLS